MRAAEVAIYLEYSFSGIVWGSCEKLLWFDCVQASCHWGAGQSRHLNQSILIGGVALLCVRSINSEKLSVGRAMRVAAKQLTHST